MTIDGNGIAEPNLDLLRDDCKLFDHVELLLVNDQAVCRGERRSNGVAILARWTPVLTRMDLPGGDPDRQRRYLEAAEVELNMLTLHAFRPT